LKKGGEGKNIPIPDGRKREVVGKRMRGKERTRKENTSTSRGGPRMN